MKKKFLSTLLALALCLTLLPTAALAEGQTALPTDAAATITPSNGTPVRYGHTLTASLTGVTESDAGDLTYKWYRTKDGTTTQIDGADAKTYKLVADDIGCTIKVEISAANYSGSKTSDDTSAIWKGLGPTVYEPDADDITATHNSITITGDTRAALQYNVSTLIPGGKNTPTDGWQTPAADDAPLTFTGLRSETKYYILVRRLETDLYAESICFYNRITTLKAPIESATVTVAAPVKGAALATSVTVPSDAKYSGMVAWYKGSGTTEAATGTAAVNQVYTAQITLTPTTGESFSASGVTVTLNDTELTGTHTPGTDGELVFTRTFDATADKDALQGTVSINNTSPRIGDTLTAETSSLDYNSETAGTLSYQWEAGGTAVGTNSSTYAVQTADLGKTITVTVRNSNNSGSVISAATAAVQKKAAPAAPAAPTVTERTYYSITIDLTNGYEYAIVAQSEGATAPADDNKWGTPTNGKFDQLSEGTIYYIFARVAATDDTEASSASSATMVKTKMTPKVADFTKSSMYTTYNGGNQQPNITSTKHTDFTVHYGLSDMETPIEAENIINAGTYQVYVNVPANGDYVAMENLALGAWTIHPKNLSMTATVEEKPYDGTNAATIKSGTLDGVVDADSGKVSVAETSIAGTFDDPYVGTGKTVDTSNTFTLTGEKANNYKLIQPDSLTGNIKAASQNLTSDYSTEETAYPLLKGGSEVALAYLVSGQQSTPSFTIESGNEYATLSLATLKSTDNTGTVKIKVTAPAVDENNDGFNEYSSATTFIYVRVNDKTDISSSISVSGITNPGKTYDGTPVSRTGNATIAEAYAGRVTEFVYEWYKADNTRLNAAPKDAGSYYLKVSIPVGNDSYTGSAKVNFTIAQKELSITGLSATNRAYNAGISVALNTDNAALTGVVTGDDVRVTMPTTGTVADANVGTGKTVSVTKPGLTGTAAGNYTLKDITGITVTISKADPSYTAPTNLTATYGQTLANVSLSGGWSWMAPTTSVGDASETAKTFYARFTPDDTDNYNVMESIAVSVKVNKAYRSGVNLGIDTPYTAKYGTTGTVDLSEHIVTGGTASYNNIVSTTSDIFCGVPSVTNNVLSYTFVDDAGKVGRSGQINVKVTSTNYTDYNIAVIVQVVDKLSPNLSADPVTATYGETGKSVSATRNGAGAISYAVKSGSEALIDVNSTTGALTFKKAGEAWVTVSVAATDDYAAASRDVKITINKATVTVTAKNQSITVGAEAPDLTSPVAGTHYTVTGLVDGDSLTVEMKYQKDGDDATPDTSAAGSYDIVVTAAADAEKYTVNTEDGKLTITRRPVPAASKPATVTVPVSSDADKVEVKATVSGGNATVEVSDEQIEKVAQDGSGAVTVDVSGLKNAESATLPAHVVEKADEARDTALTVALPSGSVSLDEKALASISEGEDVTVSVQRVPATDLNEALQKAVGDMANIGIVVDVDLHVGSAKRSSFNGGKLTISVPYTPKKNEDVSKLTVWFIRDDGSIENMGGYYDAARKCFVFETDHLSRYLLVNTAETQGFVDVPVEKYFYSAVNWAASNGITGGVDETHFAPYASCTRGQLVTFLWRAAGQPAAKNANTFSDVAADRYCEKAVAWAAENEIVGGYDDGTFRPDATVTRQQTAAILWRFAKYAGMDVSVGEDTNILSFSDALTISDYAFPAIQWAVGAEVMGGSGDKLLPRATCTRAQIVTMLYRSIAK